MRKIILILSVFACFSICAEEEFSEKDQERIARKMQQIVIKVKKDLPDNYSLQLYRIKNEIEAMLEMEKLSKKMKISTKENTFHEIRAKRSQL